MTNPEPQPTSQPPVPEPPKPSSPVDSSKPDEPARTFTQADVDRIVAERVGRANQRHADETKELRSKAASADKLQRERETETERVVREAREQAQAETLNSVRPTLVAAEFRAAAAGRIDAARLATLTDDIDLTRYLLDDGTVDTEKVANKVAAWAPDPGPAPPRVPKPDPTQGPRNSKSSGTDVGREMFEARRNRRRPT